MFPAKEEKVTFWRRHHVDVHAWWKTKWSLAVVSLWSVASGLDKALLKGKFWHFYLYIVLYQSYTYSSNYFYSYMASSFHWFSAVLRCLVFVSEVILFYSKLSQACLLSWIVTAPHFLKCNSRRRSKLHSLFDVIFKFLIVDLEWIIEVSKSAAKRNGFCHFLFYGIKHKAVLLARCEETDQPIKGELLMPIAHLNLAENEVTKADVDVAERNLYITA